MLTARFPELAATYGDDGFKQIVDPFLLQPQIPIYASPQFDCCKWDANLPLKVRGSYHVYSWSTMGDLVRTLILKAANSRPGERLNYHRNYLGEVLALQVKGFVTTRIDGERLQVRTLTSTESTP
jgi:hypothetical protein